jgi:hypothetical protein
VRVKVCEFRTHAHTHTRTREKAKFKFLFYGLGNDTRPNSKQSEQLRSRQQQTRQKVHNQKRTFKGLRKEFFKAMQDL